MTTRSHFTFRVDTWTHFTFRVDTWTPGGENIVEHVAGIEDYQVALLGIKFSDGIEVVRSQAQTAAA